MNVKVKNVKGARILLDNGVSLYTKFKLNPTEIDQLKRSEMSLIDFLSILDYNNLSKNDNDI